MAEVDGLLEVAGPSVDIVKLGWGTAVVAANLSEKLERYAAHDIPVVLGGTLTEIAIRQGRVDGLVEWLRELGLRHVEISDGTIELEPDVNRLLDLAGLDESFAGRDASKLSVGEQQRAMLGRALAQGPSVLLLDEPTSALHHAARDAIEAALAELRRELEIAVVLVTHDPEQARRLSDWVVRLEAGRVAGCGALAEVLA